MDTWEELDNRADMDMQMAMDMDDMYDSRQAYQEGQALKEAAASWRGTEELLEAANSKIDALESALKAQQPIERMPSWMFMDYASLLAVGAFFGYVIRAIV